MTSHTLCYYDVTLLLWRHRLTTSLLVLLPVSIIKDSVDEFEPTIGTVEFSEEILIVLKLIFVLVISFVYRIKFVFYLAN